MAELPDRVPGEIIFSSFENDLIQRSVQRYTDTTQRNALNPVPEPGAFAYLTADKVLQVWDGSEWINFTDEPEFTAVENQVNLNTPVAEVVVNKVFSTFDSTTVVLTGSNQTLKTIQIPTTGDWMFTAVCQFESEIPLPGVQQTGVFRILDDGGLVKDWGVSSFVSGDAYETEFNQVFLVYAKNVNAGSNIIFQALQSQGSGTITVSELWLFAEEISPGLLQ